MQHPNKLDRRARFARAAVFHEFRPRDARAIDYHAFTDREPDASCRPATLTTPGRVGRPGLRKESQ